MKQVMKKEACVAKFEIFGIGKFNKRKPFYDTCDFSRHPGIGRGHPQRECSSIC